MGTPFRTTILSNLLTTFQGITVANGYKTTVVKVERTKSAKTWEEVQDADRPYIGIVPGWENFDTEHAAGALYLVEFDIALACYVPPGADSIATSAALTNLADDVKAVIAVDRTRGGVASDTWVKRRMTDEGDTEEDGCLRIDLKVRFFESEAKS